MERTQTRRAMVNPRVPGSSAPNRTPSDLKEQYHDSARLSARIRLHRQFSTNPAGWQPWVFDRVVIPEGARVFELGCGVADLWGDNLERIPPCRLVLSDLSPGMVRESRAKLSRYRGHVSFLIADAQAIPFPDACFHVVIANHMLYHVPSLELAVSEIRRILKPGGRLYASTVGTRDLHELKRAVALLDKESPGEPAEMFCLENARAALGPCFSTINVHRYKDSLAVTDVEALISYILSSSTTTPTLRARLAELRDYLEAELAEHGAIRITKDAGIIEALV